MLKVPDSKTAEFSELFENHRLHNSACNIYFQSTRMIANKARILNRETFRDFYDGKLMDIELVSSPIDAFVPAEDSERLFVTNQLVPEYVEIAKRVTLDDIFATLPPTNDAYVALKENPDKLDAVLDDIFIHYCTFKYLAQIDIIRLRMYSNLTPLIEYVVKEVSLKELQGFLTSKTTDVEKYEKYCKDIIFNPDINRSQKFYGIAHDDIPAFDVVNLMMRLVKNLVFKTDIYIILGIYMTMSFAISDIATKKNDDSPCVAYVRDVLSKL